MKIKDIQHELLYDRDRLIITFDKKDRMELISKLEALGLIDEKAEYDLTIKKHRHRRSQNANSYMWVLADKIADATHCTKEEVYRNSIRNVGVFNDVAIKNKAVGTMVKSWSERGVGWYAEAFDCTLEGCKRVRLYYGSSTYDTKQMSRLIDDMVEEAKGLNIETATPDELARMKAEWSDERIY